MQDAFATGVCGLMAKVPPGINSGERGERSNEQKQPGHKEAGDNELAFPGSWHEILGKG